MFARCEDHLTNCDLALLSNSVSNDGECLATDFAIRHDVIWGVEVKLVDFFLWYELVDLDCALALDRYGLKLLGTNLDVGAFANLVPLDDLFGIDLFARFSIVLCDTSRGGQSPCSADGS